MTSSRFVCTVALCSTALAATPAAQTIPWMTRVRLVTDTGVVEGRMESVDSTTYRIRVNDDYLTFRRAEVSSVLRFSSRRGRGVAIGAIGGFAALATTVGADVVNAACNNASGCDSGRLPQIVFGAIGALGGG